MAAILDRIRASPVVYADETGWRQHNANGYGWTFSTPTERYFLRTLLPAAGSGQNSRGPGASWTRRCAMLSPEYWSAIATRPTTIMMAPSNAAGPTCCGTSMTCAPSTPMLRHWPGGPTPSTGFTTGPEPALIPRPSGGAPPNWPWNDNCWPSANPFRHDPSATQAKLCRRIERHIKSLPRTGYGELFVFVAEPAVPSDNNAAERSLRHLVISRKINGGTRSERGTERKMTLASLFGTWRAQGLNPLAACRQLLVSPLL